MARLTVVVSQSQLRDSGRTDLEETLVAELMMTAGLDATMIGPLDRVQPDDTDFLCLASFNHSFAVVSWLDAHAMQQQWERLGLEGTIVELDPQNLSNGQANRRIFHIQLTPDSQIPALVATLKQMLADRNVKTVTIGIGSVPDSTSQTQTPERSRASESAEKNSEAPARPFTVSPEERQDVNTNSAPRQSSPRPAPPAPQPPSEYDEDFEEEWEHLDQLVDDFDQLDL